MRNGDFSWGKMQQKAFEDIESELHANPLVQPYSLQKEATVTTDASEKPMAGFFRKKDIQSYMAREQIPQVDAVSRIDFDNDESGND